MDRKGVRSFVRSLGKFRANFVKQVGQVLNYSRKSHIYFIPLINLIFLSSDGIKCELLKKLMNMQKMGKLCQLNLLAFKYRPNVRNAITLGH